MTPRRPKLEYQREKMFNKGLQIGYILSGAMILIGLIFAVYDFLKDKETVIVPLEFFWD